MFASTVAMLQDARRGGYAVPAFNVLDDLSVRALIATADRLRAPVILQVSVKTVRSWGLDAVTASVRSAAAGVRVPVALHLDHCPERAVISDVVRAGWSSVLFDASSRDFEDAVRETAEVVEEAHARGVEVEMEIENIVGVEDGVGSDELVHAYSVQQVFEVGEQTGADMLAPHLGTAHGEYSGRPVLLPHRVTEFMALGDKPVVLHGGTGLTAEEFRSFIDAGVSKINISTALKQAYMKSALIHLKDAEASNRWDPPTMFRAIDAGVQTMAEEHFRMFGAVGQIGEK